MSEDKPSKDRIPFETLSSTTPVTFWQLPSMQTSPKRGRGSKSLKDSGAASASETIDVVPKNKKPRQLTADQLQQISEDARKEGFQQGLCEGTEQGIREGTKAGEKAGEQRAYMEAKKDIQALQNQLRQISERLFDPMQQQETDLENLIVDISLNLAKRLIESEIHTNPAVLVNVISKVLKSIPKGTQHIQVYLNDKDAELIESLVPEEQRKWEVQRDDTLESGGCRVESDSSLVDFSIETRLNTYLSKIDLSSAVDAEREEIPNYAAQDETLQDDNTNDSIETKETDIDDDSD